MNYQQELQAFNVLSAAGGSVRYGLPCVCRGWPYVQDTTPRPVPHASSRAPSTVASGLM